MRTILITFALGTLFTGCSEFTFQPKSTPPKSEHDVLVQKQQQALQEQQESALDNYRL